MIDRIIKLLVLSLGALLIFLVGVFVAGLSESPQAPEPTPRVEAEPTKVEPGPHDLPTKRVKTIAVRPETLSESPKIP